jgi:hypothetical protein
VPSGYWLPTGLSEVGRKARTREEQLQRQLRNALDPLVVSQFNAEAPWGTYTPTWTAGAGSPSLGTGTLSGSYRLIGSTLDCSIQLVWGGTTSAAGTTGWFFTLPSGLEPTSRGAAMCRFEDNGGGGGSQPGVAVLVTASNTVEVRSIVYAQMTAAVPFAWASGDAVYVTIAGIEVS